MIIDCDRCNVRGLACANCAITFITVEQAAPPPQAARAGQPPQAPQAASQLPQSAPQPPQTGPHAAEALTAADASKTAQSRQARRTEPRTGQAAEVELDAADLRAMAVLASAGLIPPLRYAPAMAQASLG